MTRRALLWLVPLFITVHNLEELFTFRGVLLGNLAAKIPPWAARLIPAGVFPPTERQYAFALLIVTALPYLFALLGGAKRERGLRTFLLVGIQMVMLVNVLSHVAMMNILNGYAPGLVTALLINLVFSLYFFGTGLRQGWLKSGDFLPLVLIAILVQGPGLFGLMLLTRQL